MFIGKNIKDMEKMGLQLTAEEIYSINNSSLKDAIVQFDGGCTAEIISKDGLLLTNHHCGYDKIAELSTPENDYLTHGFWAKKRSEELAPKSISVRFFVRMDNVTDRILSLLTDSLSEKEREQRINQEIAKIQAENDEDRSEEHTSELQSRPHLVCRLLLEKKKIQIKDLTHLTMYHLHLEIVSDSPPGGTLAPALHFFVIPTHPPAIAILPAHHPSPHPRTT